MTHEALKDYATVLQSIATVISFIIGGIWVYMKYIRQQEKYPHIEFFADINFVGKQQGFWIVELIASIENKGKVEHKINEFGFDLNALYCEDKIDVSQEWGGQGNFPHLVTKVHFFLSVLVSFLLILLLRQNIPMSPECLKKCHLNIALLVPVR